MNKASSIFLPLCLLLTSCSVYMAVNKPGKKDFNVLNVGTPRDVVLGEFGPPISSTKNDEGELVEYWSFRQGDTRGEKARKATSHAALDVVTLGLWELYGPRLDEKDLLTYIITFDKDEKVKAVKILGKGGLQQNR